MFYSMGLILKTRKVILGALMKTNKSYQKRIKVTKNGKLMTRKSGLNHFNAKGSVRTHLRKGRAVEIHMSNQDKGRFLNNI